MDREKVIEALHCRGQDLMIDLPACDQCDYQIQIVNRMGCDFRQLCRDALALLKEQDAEIENLKQTCQSMMEGVCLLKEQEAVVRCKDCLYGADFDIDVYPYVAYQCAKGYGSHLGDWFCADGRKR